MFNQSRRTLLKGLAYSSALTLGSGLSGLAMAKSNTQVSGANPEDFDVHLLPTQHSKTETLRLFNHTDTDVTIGGIDRLNQDGSRFLAIRVTKPNQQAGGNGVTLTPGESGNFVVVSNNSTYRGSKVNTGILPVTVFDSEAV